MTSWSLFEAAACGAKLAVNKIPATEEIAENESVTWVDLDEQADLSNSLGKALEDTNRPCAKIKPGFELSRNLRLWEQLLNQSLRNNF